MPSRLLPFQRQVGRRSARSGGCARGFPQFHPHPRRHYGQRSHPARRPDGVEEMGREYGHPFGRFDVHRKLPSACKSPLTRAPGGSVALFRHGGPGLRGSAVRYGFRGQGFRPDGQLHYDDRAQDGGAARLRGQNGRSHRGGGQFSLRESLQIWIFARAGVPGG